MRFNGRDIVSLILTLISLGMLTPAQARDPLENLLPATERSIFILDVSGSTNSSQLWKNSLRPSIIKKLTQQPFGNPTDKGLKFSSPTDIFIGVINSQSIDAPTFPIVSLQDARVMWGLIDKIGESPTSSRLERIHTEIFGGQGAYTKQARVFLMTKLVVPKAVDCQYSTIKSFSPFLNDLEDRVKKDTAKVICSIVISIAKRLELADNYFKTPNCGESVSCSNIVGAILRTTASAQDLYNHNRKSKLCVAIASDMLNNFNGMQKSSSLNSRWIALTAATTLEANNLGGQAARDAGVKFPIGMSVRIAVLGQGTGSKPIPLDRNSILNAYWRGFWDAAGISSTSQIRSLDEACT